MPLQRATRPDGTLCACPALYLYKQSHDHCKAHSVANNVLKQASSRPAVARRCLSSLPGRRWRLGRVGVNLGCNLHCKISPPSHIALSGTDSGRCTKALLWSVAPPGRATPPWRPPTSRWAPAQSFLLHGCALHRCGARPQVLAGALVAATAAATTATCLKVTTA